MLTQEQKQDTLRQHGYDPSQYTMDDNYNVYPSNVSSSSNVQPAVGTNDVLTKPESQSPVASPDTPLTTFGKSALQSAPSALATGAGAAAGVAATPWIAGSIGLAPETSGLSLLGLLVPLLTGGAAGYGASKLQQAIEPDSMQQNVAESEAANPRSAFAGNLATLPLAGMNPSPTSAVKALGTLGKLGIGMGAEESELANLANAGLGAGIGAGTSAAQSVLSGQSVDSKSLLENAAIGALFNKPNAIGKFYKFHPTPPDISTLATSAARTGEPIDAGQAALEQVPADVQTKPTLNPIDVLRGVSTADVGMSLPKWNKAGYQLPQKEVITPRKNAQTSAADIDMLTRDNAPVEDRSSVIADYQKQVEYERMLNEKAQQDLRDKLAAQQEVNRQNAADQQSQLAASAMEIKNALQSGIARPETRPAPLATTPLGNEIPKDFTGVTEQNNLETKNESPEDLANRQAEGLGDRYQEERPIDRTDFEKQMMDKARAAGLADKPTKNLFDLLNHWFQQKRGVGLRLNSKIPGMGETSVPTDAKSSLLGYLSQINPSKASVDTLFHEPFHVFYNRLKYSDRPSDQRLVGKFEKLVSNLPEYQEKFGNDPHGVEEYITSNQGWEAVRRHILNDEGGLKSYFKDVSVYLKTRFSDKASEADFRRILDYRFANDPVWTKQHGSQLSDTGITSERQQDDRSKVNSNEQDLQDYRTLDDQRNKMISDGTAFNEDKSNFTPEFKDLWQRLEDIKNKNGGMPPSSNRFQSDRQTRPEDDSVKQAIDNLVKGTDDASIKPEHVDELTRALIEQVDWRKAPEVKHLLEQPNFDNLDPDVWSTIKKVYENAMGKRVTLKQAPESQTTKQSTNAEQAPTTKTKNEGSKTQNVAQQNAKTNEEMPGKYDEYVKDLLKKRFDEVSKEYSDAEKSGDKKLMASKQEELRHITKIASTRFQEERLPREGEGKTPYPFTLKELNKGEMTSDKVYSDLNREAFSGNHQAANERDAFETPERNQRNREVTPDKISLGAKDINKAGKQEQKNEKDIGWTTFKPTMTQNEVVLKKGGAEGKRFIDAINQFYPERDQMYAKYYNDIHDATSKLSRAESDNVERTLVAENRSKKDYSSYLKTANEKEAYNTIRDSLRNMQEDRIDAKQPVTRFTNDGKPFQDKARVDPFYYPNQIAPKVIDALTKTPNSDVAVSLKKDFIQHQVDEGKTPSQAQSVLNSILKTYDSNASDQSHFRGLDVQQGVGLPDSWMRPGLQRNLSRYVRKFSTARAFHDNIEANPGVAKSLGYTQDAWGKPVKSDSKLLAVDEAHNIIDKIRGDDYSPDESKLKSFNRIATSLMLGPLTNIHIAASSLFNGLSYFHPSDTVKALTHVATNWSDGIQHAVENGYIKKNTNSLNALVDAHTSSQEKLNTVANAIQTMTGRNATDYVTKGILQNLGEYLTKVSAVRAANGDKSAIRLMQHIDPEYSNGKQYSPDEINKLASTFGGILHGSHDSRTLPPWMLKDTMVQPFLSLMNWNVSQTNNFMRHVWTPMVRDGNYVPMITATLGSLLGGYVIKELREDVSNRKSPFPSLQELAASDRGIEGNIPLVAYNLMAMANYSGYAGLIGTGAKSIADMAFKNTPQSATFPLDEALSSSVTSVSQAISAFMNEQHDDYLKIGTNLISDLLKNNVQMARLGINTASESGLLGEQKQQQAKLGKQSQDIRRFKMAEGMPYESQAAPSGSNPYMDLGEKKFRYTQDISEAASELPDLIREAMTKANGNVGVLREELNKLKSSGGYNTMFDPNEMPQSFLHYLNYLRTTEGESAASDRLVDYFKQRATKEAKNSMVPSI